MENLLKMTSDELAVAKKEMEAAYAECKAKNLNLDMTRGKPCSQQLDHVTGILEALSADDYKAENGTDCRNYGILSGIPEAKALFAGVLGTTADRVIVGNGSSLNLMYDTVVRAILYGEVDSEKPWSQEPVKKWLCPVPGYDRHFGVTQSLGFELIPVPMTENGPDMEIVERFVAEDAAIKGMWCVPLYSNPDGIVYSAETCTRLAAMKTAAKDFRIYWDNAYVVHHLYEDKKGSIPDILALCEAAGNPNRVYEFASTSKVTLAGSGISCIAANPANAAHAEKNMSVQTIGPDKINELRHVRYFQGANSIENVMKRHADIIRPKFEMTVSILDKQLKSASFARWNNPMGGYFVSLFVYPGTAKRVVSMAKEIGVAFTPAGATYPCGFDPKDENIRIAPTFPAIGDVEQAVDVLCVCAKLAAVEKRLTEV